MVFVDEADYWVYSQIPEETRPFEYAPGQFVDPDDECFISTVFYTFINKVARAVRESHPEATVATFAYIYGNVPPACEIEDNVLIVYAPITEDFSYSLLDPAVAEKNLQERQMHYAEWLTQWCEKCDRMMVYNYYGCYRASANYERPIWSRIQEDLQNYIRLGIVGVTPEGVPDSTDDLPCERIWTMNQLTFWLYGKLTWNPYEDVDALIELFCDKVYGEAASHMKEYYRLLKDGWDTGRLAYRKAVTDTTVTLEYYKQFVRKSGVGHGILEALENAYNTASGPVKEEILYVWKCAKEVLSTFRTL